VAAFFNPQPTPEGGLHAPATQRNREPILEVLRRVLPKEGLVLEISSGTGQHAAFFAEGLPGITWQPSDPSPAHLQSIEAWLQSTGAANLLAPVFLDVLSKRWPLSQAAAIVNINMIHIAPWEACEALMTGAAAILAPGAPLFLYGPFKRNGEHTSESNAAFDARLRNDDPRFGVRDLADVKAVAQRAGFRLQEVVEMPANNLSVVFVRSLDSSPLVPHN
jgi:SAM-dependent methyltransferase